MEMGMYSIYDYLAGEYGPIFESKNNETAKRSYNKYVQDQKVNKNEYAMVRIGIINHETGEVKLDPRIDMVKAREEMEDLINE